MSNSNKDNKAGRIFARQIARELSNEELELVAGGSGDGTRSICCCGGAPDHCRDWDDSDEGTPISYPKKGTKASPIML